MTVYFALPLASDGGRDACVMWMNYTRKIVGKNEVDLFLFPLALLLKIVPNLNLFVQHKNHKLQ